MVKKAVTLGIDLGGTKIDIGIVDASGQILRHEIIKTNKNQAENVVKDILTAIKKLKTEDVEIITAGVGMAGQIDDKTGLVHFAPNLGWKKFPLGQELETALNLPVKVTNDVRAAAWGEWLFGAGKGCQDLICLFVGTGIGAGIISGGKMLSGSSNTAGEVGHMTIDLKGPICTCGNQGCFEALASGWAIAKQAKQAIIEHPVEGKQFLELVGSSLEEVTAKNVIEAYKNRSPIALKIIENVKQALVGGTVGLVNAFNPAKIILGGGIITGLPELIEVMKEEVPKRALKAAVNSLEIIPAQLKNEAGVVGASAFALTSLKQSIAKLTSLDLFRNS